MALPDYLYDSPYPDCLIGFLLGWLGAKLNTPFYQCPKITHGPAKWSFIQSNSGGLSVNSLKSGKGKLYHDYTTN